MSERIHTHDNRATIRWKLLTGASALALTAYVASAGAANADDSSRPTVWIELGGQMETTQGLFSPFTAPFMSLTPTPDVFKGVPFAGSQDAPRFSFGEDGKISFQPDNSDWIFSAGIRYGRSHANRHSHAQRPVTPYYIYHHQLFFLGVTASSPVSRHLPGQELADTQAKSSESHFVLDFTAGKDVGLGLFGRDGSSTINAGVRFASFKTHASTTATGRPKFNYFTNYVTSTKYGSPNDRHNRLLYTFHQFTLYAQATRSFKGIGPTLSWTASAALAGNRQDGELTFDWGIDAALLFGKQKATVSHMTRAYHRTSYGAYPRTYYHPHHRTSSRNVTVPNIGGYAGLSVKYTDVKVSIGYRYDTFLNAMDTGIDAAKKSNVTFNGPFASLSIGLGD